MPKNSRNKRSSSNSSSKNKNHAKKSSISSVVRQDDMPSPTSVENITSVEPLIKAYSQEKIDESTMKPVSEIKSEIEEKVVQEKLQRKQSARYMANSKGSSADLLQNAESPSYTNTDSEKPKPAEKPTSVEKALTTIMSENAERFEVTEKSGSTDESKVLEESEPMITSQSVEKSSQTVTVEKVGSVELTENLPVEPAKQLRCATKPLLEEVAMETPVSTERQVSAECSYDLRVKEVDQPKLLANHEPMEKLSAEDVTSPIAEDFKENISREPYAPKNSIPDVEEAGTILAQMSGGTNESLEKVPGVALAPECENDVIDVGTEDVLNSKHPSVDMNVTVSSTPVDQKPPPLNPPCLPIASVNEPREVKFTWPADGRSVRITGSFNGWEQQLSMKCVLGTHELCIPLKPGKYAYKYVVDNEWHYDITAPTEVDGAGNVNNTIIVG